MGAVLTPLLVGIENAPSLPHASSLCGACTETCPVKIDLHHHLLHNRRNAATEKPSRLERLAYRLFAFVVNRPGLYQFGKELARLLREEAKVI
jgi:L-lactate dehydrogenase complex protein LldF